MEPSEAHHFISGRAAAPLHIRRTFRTAPSDWLRRVHWVWRLARGASAPAGQRGQAAWKLTYTLSMSTIQGWVEEDRKKRKEKKDTLREHIMSLALSRRGMTLDA